MNTLKKIERGLARLEGWLIVLFLTLMVALTFLQVILRALSIHAHLQWANFLMGALDWSEPFVRLLVLWLTFLGASILTRENKHIRIDLMSELLPSGWQPLRDFMLSVSCVIVSAFALKASIDYILVEMTYGSALFLSIPTWIAQAIIPIGFSTILFRFLLRTLEKGTLMFRGLGR